MGDLFLGLGAGAGILALIAIILGCAVLPFFIFYLITKAAVKNGILEANRKLEREAFEKKTKEEAAQAKIEQE